MHDKQNVREVLQNAWMQHNPNWPHMTATTRFLALLDAEAYLDAAMMLVPENHRIVTMTETVERTGWYVKLAVHSPHKALPAVEAAMLPIALATAALKAKEQP